MDHSAQVPHQSGALLARPRLCALLQKVMDYPLVLVCAGTGYGKTRMVQAFFQEYDAHKAWMQISDEDNTATSFWENFTSSVSPVWPETGARYREIGLPATDEVFTQFWAAVADALAIRGRHLMVFDDFHLLHNPTILSLFKRFLDRHPPNFTAIVISRTAPDLNLIGLKMHERIFTIQEDALCFTEAEIADYCSQRNLPVAREDIQEIYENTRGWAFAVNMVVHSLRLRKEQRYVRDGLEAMKKNIFRLLEVELSQTQTLSAPLWRFLLHMSLLDHLAASLIKMLAKHDETLIKAMEQLNAYIRHDYTLDTYIIHYLFLAYLRQKQDLFLTEVEKSETYKIAGAWCEENGYHTDAFSYYGKSGDYDLILRKVALLNMHISLEVSRYVLDILEHAPDTVRSQNPLFPGMHLRLKINLCHFDEGTVALARRYAAEYEARPESPERNRSLTIIYAHWGNLLLNMCTQTDVYDFDVFFQKMLAYFDKSPFKTIGTYTMLSKHAWASFVGTQRTGAMEEFISAIARSNTHISRVLKKFLTGFYELLQGELCFYRGALSDAAQYLQQAIEKASAGNQYHTHCQGLIYLMQIDFLRGDLPGATGKLQAMEALLSEKDFFTRYTMYDFACGFFRLTLGQVEQVPAELKEHFSDYLHSASLEKYTNRLKALYHYHTGQYNALLAFINEVQAQPMILFCKIDLKIMQALSLYKLKQRSEAISAFTEAYALAETNKLIVAFSQYAKDMRTLAAVAQKDTSCLIPKKWLEDIQRRSSAYAKRKAKMVSAYRLVNNLANEIVLTVREIAILKDLSQGLSRSEIAANRTISLNTVKMAISSIYNKLYVASLPDAVRVAVEHKIL